MSWFQALLIKLGLGDWLESFSVEALKQYLETLKKNIGEKVEEHKQLARTQSGKFREALPEGIKSRIPLSAAQ